MVDLSELKEQLEEPTRRQLMADLNHYAEAVAARDEYIAKLEAAVRERDQIIEKLVSKIKNSPKPPKKVIIHRTMVQQQPSAPLMNVDLPMPQPEMSEQEFIQKQLGKVGAFNPNTAAGTNYLKTWNKTKPKF